MTESADNTAAQQRARGRPFRKGQSGNPKGRPKGSLNKSTLMAAALLDDEAAQIVRKCITLALAKKHDPLALKLCLERLIPLRRELPVEFEMPSIRTAKDCSRALEHIATACASGQLTTSQAADLAKLVETQARVLSDSDVEQRIEAIERSMKKRS